MNKANPFQFPTWAQINREQRRRQRFKKIVIATGVFSALLLVSLLILGTKTELAARGILSTAKPRTPQVATPPPATVRIPGQTTTAVPHQSSTVYVVKTGDTLNGIAKAHRITVNAIKMANGLASDRILIGEHLEIPGARAPH